MTADDYIPLHNHAKHQVVKPAQPSKCRTTRYVIFFWCWLGLILVYAMRVNLSVAINPMQAEYRWTNDVKGFVLSSFFIGYVFGQIPGGYLATMYGGKWVFGIGVLSTAILTLLLPWAACGSLFCPASSSLPPSNTTVVMTTTAPSSSSSSSLVLPPDNRHLLSLDILRVFMGLFESVTYPALMAILAKWSPPNERAGIVSLTFSGAQIGTAIAFPLAAYIASQHEPNASIIGEFFERWPGVFYFFGCAGVLWFVGWCYFVHSSPMKHPRISKQEVQYILDSQQRTRRAEEAGGAAGGAAGEARAEEEGGGDGDGDGEEDSSTRVVVIPKSIYYALLTEPASLVIMLNHFTNNWSLYLMLTWMPSYMDKMLGFDLKQSGICFLPYLVMAVISNLAGGLADWLITSKAWSKRSARILMQLSGNLIPAASFILLGYMRNTTWALFVMIVAVASSGAAYPGYSANCLDICPKYAGVFYSLSNTIATVPGIVAPILAGLIVGKPPTFGEWQTVFAIAASLYVVGNIFYVKYCRGTAVPSLNP